MNIITFDIEEWYLQKMYFGNHAEKYTEFDYFLEEILNALDKYNFKATFFCVGGMATEFPAVVRKIAKRGHEIGCHSFKHVWLNKMTEKELFEDTRTSLDALEQCIGKEVISYRAPAFTIGNNNKWALDILAECGIKRDASIFPAERDFGGFAQFGTKSPAVVSFGTSSIKEFPICITKIWGHELAYSGGGYFRFLPLSFVKKEMAHSDYNMMYFHIGDLNPKISGVKSREEFEQYYKIPGTLKNRYMRCLKTNFGRKRAFNNFLKILETTDFVNLEQADLQINWDNVPNVIL